VLEHLSLEDLRVALRNTFSLLAPGGTFRLVMPDLEAHIQTYLAEKDPRRAIHFCEGTKMGRDRRPRTAMGMLHDMLGHEHHLWMWDEASLSGELREAGFTDVRRARLGDSRDAQFREIENPSRWEGCLGLECRKPAGH
jgi:predicted SAM-dependent methyltransferase